MFSGTTHHPDFEHRCMLAQSDNGLIDPLRLKNIIMLHRR